MTLAQFKRDAAQGNLCLELTERYGKTGDDIPESLRGLRWIRRMNTVAVFLQGRGSLIESELRLSSAKLVEYDGKTLTIYAAGLRDPNEQEQQILAEWQQIEAEYDKQNPFGDAYWKKKLYFSESACPYMSGLYSCQGKTYMQHLGKVRDKQLRGDAILKYNVYHGAGRKEPQL